MKHEGEKEQVRLNREAASWEKWGEWWGVSQRSSWEPCGEGP